MPARELVEHTDDLVLHEAQPLGAAPALAVLLQQALRPSRGPATSAALRRCATAAAQFVFAAGTAVGERCEVGGNGAMVEQFDGAARGKFCRQHAHRIAEAGSCHGSPSIWLKRWYQDATPLSGIYSVTGIVDLNFTPIVAASS